MNRIELTKFVNLVASEMGSHIKETGDQSISIQVKRNGARYTLYVIDKDGRTSISRSSSDAEITEEEVQAHESLCHELHEQDERILKLVESGQLTAVAS